MASRRTLRILLVVGAILLIGGIAAVALGSQPARVNETDYLPPGWEYYQEFPKAVLTGGTIDGSWQTENGTPMQVLVYNDADYGAYVYLDNRTALYNVTATSGSLSLTVPGFNTYHVVAQHAAGYEDTDLTFTLQLTQTGLDPTLTIGGAVAIVFGALSLAYVVHARRSPESPAGILPSRATIEAPSGTYTPPDTSTSGGGVFRVPPPRPGSSDDRPGSAQPPASKAAAPSAVPPAQDSASPVGTLLVTVQNASAAEVALDLVVNGAAVTSMSVPAGQSQEVSVSARLSSPFGSTVTVEAVMANGHRSKQAVFVGARGTAPVTLRVG